MDDSLLLTNFVVEGNGRLISDFVPNRLAGDYGFDPLGLGEDPESLRWYVQAELVHARFAMLGVAGILLTDVSHSELCIF